MSVNRWQLDRQIGQKFSLMEEKEKIMNNVTELCPANDHYHPLTKDVLPASSIAFYLIIGSNIQQYLQTTVI